MCFLLRKMTVIDQLKILDDKIKANQAQYDVDRLAAKISALSSGELEKYEYLTGEDLKYKPVNRRRLNRLNFIILHWINFLIKDEMKKIKKRTFEKTKKC